MKTNVILFLMSVFLLCSCSNKKSTQENDTPEALQNDGSSGALLSKRSYGDLVDELYAEIAKKSPELNDLELRIEALSKVEIDSTASFRKFNDKNIRYYGNANGNVNQIKDSVLREKIKLMVKESLAKYDKSILKQTELLSQIEKNKITLSDLYLALKIIKTLPTIEKYQSTNKPSDKPMKGAIKDQTITIILTDTLVKK